jgi:hypothetical protein
MLNSQVGFYKRRANLASGGLSPAAVMQSINGLEEMPRGNFTAAGHPACYL